MEQCGQTNGCERGIGCLDDDVAKGSSVNGEPSEHSYSVGNIELMTTEGSWLLGSVSIDPYSSDPVGLG
jgi:hypothetical protein